MYRVTVEDYKWISGNKLGNISQGKKTYYVSCQISDIEERLKTYYLSNRADYHPFVRKIEEADGIII